MWLANLSATCNNNTRLQWFVLQLLRTRIKKSRRIRNSRRSECAGTWFLIPPEEINLINNLDLFDYCLKEILKSQSLRSRPWLKAFVYFLFIFFDKTSIKTSCFAAVLAICPESLNAIKRKVNNTSKITLKWLLIIKFEEVWFGY